MISIQDVQTLKNDPSEEGRLAVITKVADHYKHNESLGVAERQLAEEIIKIAANDVAVFVKAALIEQLRDYDGISPALLQDLLNNTDVTHIVAPFLQKQKNISDADLIEVIGTHCPIRQKAIASRETVSEAISAQLVQEGLREVIATLTANDGAKISAQSYGKIYDTFNDDAMIKRNLCFRAHLPVALAEKLVTEVSVGLRDMLLQQYNISPDIARKATQHVQEKVTLFIAHPSVSNEALQKLVVHLRESKRLTDTLIMRSMCMGDMRFFTFSLAERGKVNISIAKQICEIGNDKALRALLSKAQIAATLHPAILAAVSVYKDAAAELDEANVAHFSRRVLERFLTRFPAVAVDTVDHLLEKLNSCTRSSAYLM